MWRTTLANLTSARVSDAAHGSLFSQGRQAQCSVISSRFSRGGVSFLLFRSRRPLPGHDVVELDAFFHALDDQLVAIRHLLLDIERGLARRRLVRAAQAPADGPVRI